MNSPITRVRLRRRNRPLRLAALALPPLALFLLLGGALDSAGIVRFDEAVADRMRAWTHPAWDGAARVLDAVGSTVGFAAATLLLAALLFLLAAVVSMAGGRAR